MKNNHQYPVYRNDLKYKSLQNIDPSRAIWQDKDVENDFNKDTDSLDYRIQMCRQEKYDNIDLARLNQQIITDFFESDFYKRHKSDIIHLFMSYSKIHTIPSLSDMTSLETLDISHNEITEIPELPPSITEVIAHDNKLTHFTNSAPNLLRLDLSNNKINKLGEYNKLQKLYINNNKLYNLYCTYPNMRELVCCNNPISQLPDMPLLSHLECSDTSIHQIFDFMNLRSIISNRSSLSKIDRVPKIETLEIIGSQVKNLKFFPNLKVILFNKQSQILISEQYTVVSATSNKTNDVFEVRFL